MKKNILTTIFFLIICNAYSQYIVKKTDKPVFIAGFHSAGSLTFGRDSIHNYKKYHTVLIETEPYISYYPIKNFGIGLLFKYMYTKNTDSLLTISLPRYFSYGVFLRYYLPFQFNFKYFQKQKIFFEANLNKGNFEISKKFEYPIVFENANIVYYNFIIGLNIHIYNDIYLETSFTYMKFVKGINIYGIRLGVEYHFNKKSEI